MNSEDSYQSKRIAKYFRSRSYDDFTFQENNNLIVFHKHGVNVKGFYCTKEIFNMVVDICL